MVSKNVRVLETSSTGRFFKVLTTTQPGSLGQSVASLTVNPVVASSIPARSITFVEIDHEIISTVILLLPLIKKGCSQALANNWLHVTAQNKQLWLGELTLST